MMTLYIEKSFLFVHEHTCSTCMYTSLELNRNFHFFVCIDFFNTRELSLGFLQRKDI